MWILYLSRLSYANPEEEAVFCCFPCTIKRKFFPIMFLVLFTLLGGVQPGFVVAFFLGLL